MSDVPVDDGDTEVGGVTRDWDAAAVLAGGEEHRIGRFQFFIADQRWVWSDTVARMHGYQPGQVQPTTELLLSHKHPDDRAKVAEILARVQEGGLFSSRHRIIDVDGRTRWVVVVSDRMTYRSGEVAGTSGYYIDVTDSLQSDVTTAVAQVIKSRAVIEQAKGILIAAYGIDAERAFEILKWRSQMTQIKLKDVAAQFVEAIRQERLPSDSVSSIDRLLLANDPPVD